MRDSQNNAYMQIDFAGMTVDQANTIVGTPGKFEMRIQTTGNESAHVLYGEDVAGVSAPQSFLENGRRVGSAYPADAERRAGAPAGLHTEWRDHGPE